MTAARQNTGHQLVEPNLVAPEEPTQLVIVDSRCPCCHPPNIALHVLTLKDIKEGATIAKQEPGIKEVRNICVNCRTSYLKLYVAQR